MTLDATDRRLLSATQAGLPLSPRPFAEIAREIGVSEDEVLRRFARLQETGVVRRIGVAPNHYALGMTANGMSVWDVDDDMADVLGAQIGALAFVSHCYLRPRALPDWPYNLFAMLHGSERSDVEAHRLEVLSLLGAACRSHDILYSSRILKKTGMRLKTGA
ncbi:AsnC family transcriptional regulator [Celeribacter neptunius]|uniref:siroheme decarboxylase n=1 Tax=Celeribacter neptunius TaxID=588602 RepID=A0A1I3R5J5_9RHOB|nr:AsnC family transcriptional regulator [Celeribacter neptunius]SFJ41290.1 transcriptional regulator, AsnC family [Celeribacter neptunius]